MLDDLIILRKVSILENLSGNVPVIQSEGLVLSKKKKNNKKNTKAEQESMFLNTCCEGREMMARQGHEGG